jgi:hypothetical protein
MLVLLNIVIIALILVACCFWYVSEKSLAKLKKALDDDADAPLFQSQFKCVVIKLCAHPCKKAREFQSKPILANDAPSLPMQGCNAITCKCSFERHDDRRIGVDRRDKQDERRTLIYANKRLLRDRRRASIQEFLLPKYRTYSRKF